MVVIRDNFRYRRDIELAYLAAIRTAKREILIANAYFFPGIKFRRALTAAAQRGVGVTLLWSGIGSLIIYKIVDVIVGLRVTVETEREGLDAVSEAQDLHGHPADGRRVVPELACRVLSDYAGACGKDRVGGT